MLEEKIRCHEIPENHITCVNHGKGEFRVKSCTRKNVDYLVQFAVPRCACESWRQTSFLPCKHFFAIFNFFSEWQFSNLPDAYRNSVFITLDTDNLVINPTEIAHDLLDDCAKRMQDLSNTVHPKIPPVTSITPESTARRETSFTLPELSCHAKLKRQFQDKVAGLRDVSYLVEDVNALQEAITIVDNLQAKLRACCPKAEGLFLRGRPEKKKLKITKPEYHKVFHKGLSLRKKRKSKAASRSANMINVAEKVTDNKVGYIPGPKY